MPESKEILIDSLYEKRSDETSMKLIIHPANQIKNTKLAVLNLTPLSHFINNKELLSGELCFVLKNHKTDIDLTINEHGDLLVSGEDSKNYSIDENGDLIYTFR